MKKLVIATHNKHKLEEIREILGDCEFEIVSLSDIGFAGVIPETGSTFTENAILKAKSIGEATGEITLADDSGLKIDALGGKPGIYSARYAPGTDQDRINKILVEMRSVPKEKRTAAFIAVIALYDPGEKRVYVCEGRNEGFITDRRYGTNGFGYDPIFYNFDLGVTNAQVSREEKNRVSHRARALMKCKQFLKELE